MTKRAIPPGTRELAVLAALLLAIVSLPALARRQQLPPPKPTAPRTEARVVMISIDGLPGSFVSYPDRHNLHIPELRRMKLSGAFAREVEGVYPTLTYPSHTTLVTGCFPAKHGIVMNTVFRDPTQAGPEQWFWNSESIQSPALWDACRRAGLTTASVWWPATIGARCDWLVPEFWNGDNFPPSLAELEPLSTSGLIGEYVKAAGASLNTKIDDEVVAGLARLLILSKKPNLLLVHFAEFDKQSHEHGIESREAREALERISALAGRLADSAAEAGIGRDTTFVIVSDHGMAPVNRSFNPYVALASEKLVTLGGKRIVDWKAAVWKSGGSAAIVLRDPNDKDSAIAVRKLFTNLAASANPPIRRIFERNELAKLGANPRAFLMFDAADGYTIGTEVTGPLIAKSARTVAEHGYSPSLNEMLATFIATGKHVRPGVQVSYTKMVNIAPTIAALLEVELPESEGNVVREFLDPSIIHEKVRPKPGKQKPQSPSATIKPRPRALH